MLYRPALRGNSNTLSLARRALKDKFPTPTIPLTTVLQNRQVFLPDPVYYCYVVFVLSHCALVVTAILCTYCRASVWNTGQFIFMRVLRNLTETF